MLFFLFSASYERAQEVNISFNFKFNLDAIIKLHSIASFYGHYTYYKLSKYLF